MRDTSSALPGLDWSDPLKAFEEGYKEGLSQETFLEQAKRVQRVVREREREKELNHNHSINATSYNPGFADSTGVWHGSSIGSKPIANPYPYVTSTSGTSVPNAHFGLTHAGQDDNTKEAVVKEQEHKVGNGKTTSFTFSTTEDYPAVAVYSRVVEGEDDEKTVTVTELGSAEVTVSVVQGENITVDFEVAPSRRGAVILIG